MNKLTFEFTTPEIKTEFEWQLSQEVNVFDGERLVAKAEFEILVLNKNRGAKESYQKLEALGACDWELPLNLFFTKQNVKANLAETLSIKTDAKKSQQHIMLEAISVHEDYRNQGVAKAILTQIAKEYSKVQSIFTLAMPMSLFVDPDVCETEQDRAYYQRLNLVEGEGECESEKDSIVSFFQHNHFNVLDIDESLLAEPLPFTLLVSSPSLLA
ncbi:GNAT family N-acetyltransferase [Thalassotalea sp. M1531]|uniref:GNAT family N-acetyltransferase n=1 Tax=Thalassotalea algicola TaxID=2716224 RepID=A0A7Y0Q6X0_9GAMM|nr:GNAT family N-acetyltransferase [Thalassotalea algicola]NMP32434.1 GNAT family N-acetyltransferase [Thalassotalea algicola]